MAKLSEINELNRKLTDAKKELARKKEQFAHCAAKPIEKDIIQLLKEIASLSEKISVKYLSLAAETDEMFEEDSFIQFAAKFAKEHNEAIKELERLEKSN